MRLTGARQAWFEAVHYRTESAEAKAIERAVLGKRGIVAGETVPDRRQDRIIADRVEAGYVLHAIGTLPIPLQRLGAFLYSPLADRNDAEMARSFIWFSDDYGAPDRRKERAFWLTYCAMTSHRRMVMGNDPVSPTEACAFVQDRLGQRMDPSNWARDWAPIWERMAEKIDKMDAKALAPVSEVVRRLMGEKAA